MASKRKSTTPCMVLASEPDPELEGSSELDVGPPLLTPAPTITYDTTSSEEDLSDNTTADILNKVEGGYDCKYCSFQTTELSKFAFHVDSEHPTIVFTSSYTCFDCNFTTEKYESLSEHNVKSHPAGENFKLKMVKRENQIVFEQTVNELTYDGKIVKEESPDQGEVSSEEVLGESAVSGISISKTPIMKMMKAKVENKRIAVSHNMGEDIPTEKETETAIKLDCDDVVVVEQTPAVSESVSMNKAFIANALDGAATMVTTATVFPPGLAQMFTTVQAQQNCNLVSKVLIPVNSIPSYNLALDSNPLLLNTYNKFPYPTASEISLLSAQAKCSEEQTKIWFSAQRLKHGVSWTPEEVEDARRKQYNGTVHTIPQTITVFPAHISAAANGLPSILQTCQIVGQPGLVLTQVAGANTLPVTTPIALTVAGVQNHTQLQKNNVPPSQPRTEPKQMHTVKPPPLTKHENIHLNLDPFGMRSKKSKEQLNALKVSYLKHQFASDAEIERLMQFTGLTKGEIKKWFSDTRYNQRNSKNNHNIQFINDSNSTILIDSSDEMTESPTMITPQRKQSWNPFPDFTLQKFKEKTTEQLQALEDSYLKNPVPADEELNKLRALTKLTRREIDAWFSEKRKSKEIKEEDESEVKENEEGFKEEADEQMTESGSLVKSEGSSTKVAKKSPEQLHMLKAAFVHSQWPTSEEYDKIAQESGIPRSDIVSWFGDARYSWKNGNLKWYYYYQCSGATTQNGQTCARRRGRGRPRGRGRGRPRGRPKGARRTNWDRKYLAIKFKTGKTILKDYYLKHKFLNEQDLDELVAKSHMGYEQVREWFSERMRREESGLDLFEENEDHEEDEDDLIDDIEDEDADTDESDTWEPPRHVRRRLSKTDD